jgi:hypothetical protein
MLQKKATLVKTDDPDPKIVEQYRKAIITGDSEKFEGSLKQKYDTISDKQISEMIDKIKN